MKPIRKLEALVGEDRDNAEKLRISIHPVAGEQEQYSVRFKPMTDTVPIPVQGAIRLHKLGMGPNGHMMKVTHPEPECVNGTGEMSDDETGYHSFAVELMAGEGIDLRFMGWNVSVSILPSGGFILTDEPAVPAATFPEQS